MAHTTANLVADRLIYRLRDVGDNVSNLKLQKLVYYAQAWFLAFYDRALFDEEFQAWIHGPVQPELYHRFREYGWRPIEEEIECPHLSRRAVEHLIEVLHAYNHLSALDLERLTHGEAPWIEARGDTPFSAPSTAIVTKESMQVYYKSLLSE